jgi:hypothetical protein
MAESQGVAGPQWGTAVAAVVVALCVTVMGFVIAPELGGIYFATALVVALPLALRDWPTAFSRACLVVGLIVAGWGVLGLLIGIFLFLPSALLLLVAAFVDLRNGPGWWWGIGAPVWAVALVWWGMGAMYGVG